MCSFCLWQYPSNALGWSVLIQRLPNFGIPTFLLPYIFFLSSVLFTDSNGTLIDHTHKINPSHRRVQSLAGWGEAGLITQWGLLYARSGLQGAGCSPSQDAVWIWLQNPRGRWAWTACELILFISTLWVILCVYGWREKSFSILYKKKSFRTHVKVSWGLLYLFFSWYLSFQNMPVFPYHHKSMHISWREGHYSFFKWIGLLFNISMSYLYWTPSLSGQQLTDKHAVWQKIHARRWLATAEWCMVSITTTGERKHGDKQK